MTLLDPVGALPANLCFPAAAKLVLDYLRHELPMGFWSVTRVENGRQTYLLLEDNEYGLLQGGSVPWQDTYCVHMAAGAAPAIAPDASAVEVYAQAAVNDVVDIGAYAGTPILDADGSLFGAICGLDSAPRPDIAGNERLLALLGDLLRMVLGADRALADAEQATRATHALATSDPLTGVANRRAWDDAIAKLDADYKDYADPTVIVVADLDGLKQVNDGPGGHAAGDRMLRAASQVMSVNVRDRDLVARIGGDEFGIVLANCPAAQAPALVRRLDDALAAAGAPASLGWAALSPDGSCLSAVEQADEAMYAAKLLRRSRASSRLSAVR